MSRKSEDFSGRLKTYESGQHPHAISLGYLLVVHSKKGGLPFKRQKKTQLLYKKMWTQLLIRIVRIRGGVGSKAAVNLNSKCQIYCSLMVVVGFKQPLLYLRDIGRFRPDNDRLKPLKTKLKKHT